MKPAPESPENLPAAWREEWSRDLARPRPKDNAAELDAMLVFRLAAEHFALPAAAVVEITPVPPIHRIPSRDPAAVGLVNVRGRVVVSVGFGPLLEPLGAPAETGAAPRLVVLRHGDWIFATRVDAVDGVHRLDRRDLAPLPAGDLAPRFAIGFWTLRERSVARLDEERLFSAARQSLA